MINLSRGTPTKAGIIKQSDSTGGGGRYRNPNNALQKWSTSCRAGQPSGSKNSDERKYLLNILLVQDCLVGPFLPVNFPLPHQLLDMVLLLPEDVLAKRRKGNLLKLVVGMLLRCCGSRIQCRRYGVGQ